MNTTSSTSELKTMLCNKASHRISVMYNGTLDANDTAILEDFFDDAVDAIRDWLNLKTDSFILQGKANSAIVQYIVRSFNSLGIEGQMASNVGGDVKSFKMSPLEELRNSLTQRV